MLIHGLQFEKENYILAKLIMFLRILMSLLTLNIIVLVTICIVQFVLKNHSFIVSLNGKIFFLEKMILRHYLRRKQLNIYLTLQSKK